VALGEFELPNKNSFCRMIEAGQTVVAPNVWCALTAKMAEAEGFKCLYLGGGPLGYLRCVTEANMSLPEMVDVGLEVRSASTLPLVLDGTCGWGDPMHLHRTMNMSEAAGFAGIEVEDQPMPKRAHHHIGIEHLIPQELMVAKIREMVRARRDPDFVIIGRTNAARCATVDEALRRGEAYKKAGADMLFVLPKTNDDIEYLAKRLPSPLMYMTLTGGFDSMPYSVEEMGKMGYRFLVDPMTPVLAVHHAMRESYRAMKNMVPDPLLRGAFKQEHEALNLSMDLEKLLAIERGTVERRQD
jgi:2-methylisocitrate lyase-like PEP mutase family enzyme